MSKKRKSFPVSISRPQTKIQWTLSAALAAVLALVILEITNVTHLIHGNKLPTGTIPTTSSTSAPTAASTDNSSPKGSSVVKAPTPATNTNTGVDPKIAPSGSFVGNHKPGQNGTGLTEESICITTPGAACYIQFTQDNTTKTLAAQITDDSGFTSWMWDIDKAGLTKGSWKVTAIAGVGSQIKSTIDPIPLEVQ